MYATCWNSDTTFLNRFNIFIYSTLYFCSTSSLSCLNIDSPSVAPSCWNSDTTFLNRFNIFIYSTLYFCSTSSLSCLNIDSPSVAPSSLANRCIQVRSTLKDINCRYHNTSSVSDMISNLNWETREQRRMRARVTMFYRIL